MFFRPKRFKDLPGLVCRACPVLITRVLQEWMETSALTWHCWDTMTDRLYIQMRADDKLGQCGRRASC